MNLNPLQTPSKIIQTAYSTKSRVQLICPELPYGRTKQSFRDDADINTIIKRFLRTGVLDYANKHQPRYGDATGIEYNAAMATVAAAKSMFNDLPADLRARFENEPAQFLDFIQDPSNYSEAEKLGLLKPEAVSARATAAAAASAAKALPPSHREDGSATHEPLRARDGTFREHTRKELRDEARAQKQSEKDE